MQSVTSFLKNKFSEYYEKNLGKIRAPECLDNREFGFLLFKKGVMVRHKGFKTIESARNYMKMINPSDIYYSTAYYEKPEAPMDKKNWLGADLVFDIDADHLETSCRILHDKWICENCGYSGKGIAPNSCLKCGTERLKTDSWVCEKCLDEAKKEVLKLIDMLISDFGLQPNNLHSYFSGHRGYHLHVNAEQTRMLGDDERKEIVDYILGVGLDVQLYNLKNIETMLKELELNESGWKGRITRGYYRHLNEIKKGSRQAKFKHKEILRKIITENSARIDTVVTTDTHRLIRMPETLHGKTGLRAVKVDINNLEGFDPFKESLAWKGNMNVFVLESPRFRIKDEEYGPYKKEKVNLPTTAAILLLCKGKALLKC